MTNIFLKKSSLTSDSVNDDHYRLLLRALEQIDLRLQRYTNLNRERLEEHILENFLLDEAEIENYESSPLGAPHWMINDIQSSSINIIEHEYGGLLSQLAVQYELTLFEMEVILLGMLPYIDGRYSSLFSALQRSNQKSQPSFEFAIALLGNQSINDEGYRQSLLPQSSLLKYGLITLKKNTEKSADSWSQQLFTTSVGVCQFLTGNRFLSAALNGRAQWYPVEKNEGCSYSEQVNMALSAQNTQGNESLYPVVVLEGSSDDGLLGAVRTASLLNNQAVLYLDMNLLPDREIEVIDGLVEACREVRMRDAILAIRLAVKSDEDSEEGQQVKSQINWTEKLNQPGLRVVLLSEQVGQHIDLCGMPRIVLEMHSLSHNEKYSLLKKHIDDDGDIDTNLDFSCFCRRFSFNNESLPIILQEAKSYRFLRDESDVVRTEDLNRAFSIHSRKDFGKLAQRREPGRTFDDLVVADEVKEQLNEILIATKHRSSVLERGFAKKVGYGTGVSALFCGDSGTGKTMAAEVIAGQLGVDLIKVDLSTVVNKYIGETEKNISRIFDLASSDAGVLFFDEADALFGKRSAVTDSKDRHANIEVAYLLQRLESHSGLVILATNNRNHLDDAFSRRFTFITSFKFPDEKQREIMWRKIWPEGISVHPEIDFFKLARKAELTGANIRNIALLSTWLAAEETSQYICEHHINHAIKRELAKVGRLPL